MLLLIKLGLVVAAFCFIYSKLFHNHDLSFEEFSRNLLRSNSISTNTLLILVLLSICNWLFEIIKWQTLVGCIEKISMHTATVQSLGALTASLLTPNRIGEYGAKAMYYERPLRKKIMLLNLIGNSAQMLITTVLGVIGFTYLAFNFQPEINYHKLFIWTGAIGIVSLIFVGFLKGNWFKNRKKSLSKTLTFIKQISKRALFKIVCYSLLRYFIFSFQFYYLLLLFGMEFQYLEAMTLISSMYFLASIIPSIFVFDVIIKGGVAVYLFGLIGVPETIILSIITLMWILNFVLPSVIGSYHVLNFKLPNPVS